MKKFLLLILLLICANIFAQPLNSVPFRMQYYPPHAAQYFARFDARPTGDTLKWYADFIYTLDSSGGAGDTTLWNKLDEIWIFANKTSSNAVLGVKGYKNCTTVNSPTFISYRGFAGNGTTSYLSTNFNPALHGINYTQNSASYGVYSATNSTSTGCDMGLYASGSGESVLYTKYTDNKVYCSINTSTVGGQISITITNSLGLILGNRNTSTTVQIYQNGTVLTSATKNSVSAQSFNFYIGAKNDSGTAGEFTTRQYRLAFIGGSLSTAKNAALYTAIQRLMTRLGANV